MNTYNQLMIIGASGHGKVIVDIARKKGYKSIQFLDDNTSVHECMGYPVVGTMEEAANYPQADYVVAIGNPMIREKIHLQLKALGLHIVSMIHPQAVIAEQVTIGAGTVIMAGAVVNPSTTIGEGCIVNTGASVDHDNQLADFVHVSVGAHLAGTVSIGKSTWVGIGAVVSNNISVCANCMIGAGAVVVRDVSEAGTYIGIPAKRKES